MSAQTGLQFFGDVVDQVKLKEISVYNWGSFNGLHTIHIDPDGTLITGENGSGKSTIIDALMTLLRPAGKVDYNLAAAQDKKKDRTLVSYMRGSFGSMVTDEGQVSRNLRENSTVTAVKAVYEYPQQQRKVTLLGVFYILGTSNALSDVHKLYAVSGAALDLKEILRRFADMDMRRLKDYLRSIESCRVCDDNFGEYETHFFHQLGIANKNAPALLSRALGLKRIDDLTYLIRTLVLEQGTVREDAQNTIAQFEDLKTIHERLMDARAQEQCLEKLPEQSQKYEKQTADAQRYSDALEWVTPFVNRHAFAYYQERLKQRQDEYARVKLELTELEAKHEERQREQELAHTNLVQGGGNKAENVRQTIAVKQGELARVGKELADYNRIAGNLGLHAVSSAQEFNDNRTALIRLKGEFEESERRLEDEHVAAVVKKRELSGNLTGLNAELSELKKHADSNVSAPYQQFRDELCEALDLDPQTLVYVAELIEVHKDEIAWQGAIERALGGRRQTLLVRDEDYRVITGYVNSRHNRGLHVRIQVVGQESERQSKFGNRGFLVKLNFKDHPFSLWLRQYLNRFDLICANSVEELNETEYSMTREGLIHRSEGFFEKKDLARIDDRREWCLGFSSKEKIKLLERDVIKLQQELEKLAALIEDKRSQLKDVRQRHSAAAMLENYDSYAALDLSGLERELDELKFQLETLLHDPSIARLQEFYERSVAALKEVDERIKAVNSRMGGIRSQIDELEGKIAVIQAQSQEEIPSEPLTLLHKTMKSLGYDETSVFMDAAPAAMAGELNERCNRAVRGANETSNAITRILNTFHERWEHLCLDWGTDFDKDRGYYLQHLEKIRHEGLPKLVDEFRVKLNSEVTQSVASIVNKIDQELSTIRDKIGQINGVLKKAEFSENSYLEIVAKKITNTTVQEFNRDTSKVMKMLTHDDHESRYKAIEKVIDTLQKARDSSAQEMKSLLDPRLRMQFLANVIDKETGDVRDTMNSSSGKSGGEKESFAGSVLAASLAYVLTPEGTDYPVYATVFLDEAFSNTSDKVSKRVLKIFRELKLHVNLITPFKNIELARDFAHSLVIMERNPDTHSSSMCELTWEDYDAQLKERQERELASAGIEIVSES